MRFTIPLICVSIASAAVAPAAFTPTMDITTIGLPFLGRPPLGNGTRAPDDSGLPAKERCSMTPEKCMVVGALDSLTTLRFRVPLQSGCWLGWFACLNRTENIQWHMEEGAKWGYPWKKEWNDALTEEEKKIWHVDELTYLDGQLQQVNKPDESRKMTRALTEDEFEALMEEARTLGLIQE